MPASDTATRLIEVRAIQAAHSQRVDRMEESRTVNMRRLAKNEEAVSSIKESLAAINAKLDRALMRR